MNGDLAMKSGYLSDKNYKNGDIFWRYNEM